MVTVLGTLVRQSRLESGMTARQLALAAQVPASTVTRIENGTVSPSTDMVERLVAAAGFKTEARLIPVADPAAARTARALLGGSDYPFSADNQWLERWRRIGLLREGDTPRSVSEILYSAGAATRLTARAGASTWRAATRSSDAVLDLAIEALSAEACVVTGGAAANRLVPSADARWVVLYATVTSQTATDLGWEPSDGSARRGETFVTVLPPAPDMIAGAWTDEDGRQWADPLQVVIDCYAGSGRMPDQADRVLEAIGLR